MSLVLDIEDRDKIRECEIKKSIMQAQIDTQTAVEIIASRTETNKNLDMSMLLFVCF